MRRIALSKFKFTLTLPSEASPGQLTQELGPSLAKKFRLLDSARSDTYCAPIILLGRSLGTRRPFDLKLSSAVFARQAPSALIALLSLAPRGGS